ncbi:MAG: hypothetical protein AVO33_09300 [delta proteobacterium ML8_F1]|nr:MAG: hypothetical protein AVO33_09300 [delta proteobacterium ML8_F1]
MFSDFKAITIVGLGLIGGSMAKALRDKGYKGRIYGVDHHGENLRQALKDGVIDGTGYHACDLLVLAVPVGHYEAVVKEAIGYLDPLGIVTDVGSVKEKAHHQVTPLLGEGQTFVGGHPMIGSEKSGFSASKTHLFENAYYFITPDTESEGVQKIRQLVEVLGANPLLMNPKDHDRIVSRTSHIPQINAVAMVNMTLLGEESLIDYVGGGFRDTTRIASSDPKLWKDILLNNREEILAGIKDYIRLLGAMRDAIDIGDGPYIQSEFEKARSQREKIPGHLMDWIEQGYEIFLDVQDRPGMIAGATTILADNAINIKDIEIVHARENIPGVLKLGFYNQEDQLKAQELMKSADFTWKSTHQSKNKEAFACK